MSCVAGMCLASPASGPARGEELALAHVQDDLVMYEYESKNRGCSNYQTVVIGLRECSLPSCGQLGRVTVLLLPALGPGREGA
jgi:hypothetical protein